MKTQIQFKAGTTRSIVRNISVRYHNGEIADNKLDWEIQYQLGCTLGSALKWAELVRSKQI